MSEECSACGAAWIEEGYQHAEDCRIDRAIKRAQDLADGRRLIEASSLGSSGAKKLRKRAK